MTVKRTGGAFDPADRHLLFAAGNSQHYPKGVLLAVSDIMADHEERVLRELLDAGHTVLLDSGIFWLTNRHRRAHGITMDQALALAPEDIDGFDELQDRYLYLVDTYADRLWGYIELDQGGAAHKRRTRARLEARGLAPIPVYHPLLDGWDYFDELASSYDRICFGNVVQAPKSVRLRLMHTLWERHRAYPDLWVHVLGLTLSGWCLSMPFDSADVSSWLAPVRWGANNPESVMLTRKGQLIEGFRYSMADPKSLTRGWQPSLRMCVDAADARHRVWRHSLQAQQRVFGAPTYPPYLDQETG